MKRPRQETYEPRKRPRVASLIEAVERNDVKEVKESDTDDDDDLALRLLSENGCVRMVSLMLDDEFVKTKDIFRMACESGCAEVVSFLLKTGGDYTYNDDYAYASHLAVEKGHVGVVSSLLNHNAVDVDIALPDASFYGYDEMVSMLLNAGADVHADDDEALRWASEYGYLKVVSLLLDAGANVHAKDDLALRLASEKGHVEVVYLLLNASADPEKCSKEMLAKVKTCVCSQLNSVDLPTCLKNNVICNFLIGY